MFLPHFHLLFRHILFQLVAAAILSSVPGQTSIAQEKPSAAALPPALENLFGGAFSLLDQNGARRTGKDFRGRYMLVFFGYTYCPVICPTNLEHITWALEELGGAAEKIQPIFISLDPERDTPDVLGEYVAGFDADFVALTGSESEILRVAKAYRIHRVKVLPEGSERQIIWSTIRPPPF